MALIDDSDGEDWFETRLLPRARQGRPERWDLPSGRAPARRPVSFRAGVHLMLRASGGLRLAPRPKATRSTAASRRVVVKARVVQMGKGTGSLAERLHHVLARRAARLHLSYLERDGVDPEGNPGRLYDGQGPVDRASFNAELPGEEHQFRLVVSPEDGHALDLQSFVREYMEQVQQDLGQSLIWAAVNHYNTDNPHAHIVIRGIDAQGAKVRLEREYISHGLRHRAEELATERLGPRPERSRLDQLRREAELERYTSLDRELERRAEGGVFRLATRKSRDPVTDAAIRTRLEVLEQLGLASVIGHTEWRLAPDLHTRLQVMGRQAEGLRVLRAAVRARRYRVIDPKEPPNGGNADLDGGAFGVVRWKGLDEDGRFVAVVETTVGVAYHLPVTNRAAMNLQVGQVLEIKRAVDKDARIEEAAAANGRRYDVDVLPEEYREAYRKRLEQLERMQLATPAGKSAWLLKEGFRSQVNDAKHQAYWQMLSLIPDAQPLAGQPRFAGFVWLDRVAPNQIGQTGFGKEVGDAIAARHDYLRRIGIDPASGKLRWELRDLQQRELERALVASTGRAVVRAHEGFGGVVHVHQAPNGQSFLVVHAKDSFAIVPASSQQLSLEGNEVRLRLGPKGRIEVLAKEQYDLQHQKVAERALAQIAAAVPNAVRSRVLDGGTPTDGDVKELDEGVRGILRWVGNDRGQAHAVIETPTGTAYHVPIATAAAEASRVGQLVEIQRAPSLEERLHQAALHAGGVFDLAKAPEAAKAAYRRRLEDLERLRLATRVGESEWQLANSFLRAKPSSPPRPVWLRAEDQSLEDQKRHPGVVWLDGLRDADLGPTAFGATLREALREREDYLRGVGIDPQSPKLRWELRDLQQRELEQVVAKSSGLAPVRAHDGFRGVAHVHRSNDGQLWLAVQSNESVALVAGSREQANLDGQDVRLQVGAKGRVEVFPSAEYDVQHQKREALALAQVAAAVPNAVRSHVVDGGAPASAMDNELDQGVRGVVRWVGSDDRARSRAVIETPSGAAYHVPVSNRVAAAARLGQLVEIQRAKDTDAPIREAAVKNGGVYDLAQASETEKAVRRRRLEQFERQRLATPIGEGKWRLAPSLLRSDAAGAPRPVWLRAEALSLDEQKRHSGFVWLDRLRGAELAASGFGATVRDALRERDHHLRGLGVDPGAKHLRWKLRDLQQRQLAQSLEAAGNARLVTPRHGFEGVVHLHVATNGERFVELRGMDGRFALLSDARGAEAFLGRQVRVEAVDRERPRLHVVDRGLER